MTTVFAEQTDLLIEIGPGATLLGLGRRTAAPGWGTWLPSLQQGISGPLKLRQSLTELYQRGVEVDWSAVHAYQPAAVVDLPAYPFQRRRYWLDGAGRAPRVRLGHLLERRVDTAAASMIFEGTFRLEDLPLLDDTGGLVHVGLYLELLAEAAGVVDAGTFVLEGLEIEHALLIVAGQARRLNVLLDPDGHGAFAASIYSSDEASVAGDAHWVRHCRARLHRRPSTEDEAMPMVPDQPAEPGSMFYDRLRQDRGIALGPSVRWIETVGSEGRFVTSRMRTPEASDTRDRFALSFHPGVVDSCAQLFYAAQELESPSSLYLFMGAERLCYHPSPHVPRTAVLRLRAGMEGSDTVIGDIDLRDGSGAAVLKLRGATMRRTSHEVLQRLAGAAPPAQVPDQRALRETALAASPETRRVWIYTRLLEQLAAVIGQAAGEIPTETPLVTLGIDSLMALELRDRLATIVGVDVPMVDFLGGGSVESLVDTLLVRLDRHIASPSQQPALHEGSV